MDRSSERQHHACDADIQIGKELRRRHLVSAVFPLSDVRGRSHGVGLPGAIHESCRLTVSSRHQAHAVIGGNQHLVVREMREQEMYHLTSLILPEEVQDHFCF